MTEPTLTLTAREFRDLVTPVIPMAHKDRMMPTINAVLIETRGKYLVASATDRFALGFCRVAPSEQPTEGLAILVPLASVRQIIAMFRPNRDLDPQLDFTVEDNGSKLRVQQGGGAIDFLDASITFALEQGKWPTLPKIIVAGIESDEPAASHIGLNISKLAAFKAAVRFGEPLLIKVGAADKPVVITAGDHFVGALMPQRIADSERDGNTAEWLSLLDSVPNKKAA